MKIWLSSNLGGSTARGVTGTTICRHIHEDGHPARCTTNPSCTHLHCEECGDDVVLSAPVKELQELGTLVSADVPVGQVILTRELEPTMRRILADARDPRELAVMTSFLETEGGFSRLALAA